jgi:hypothetical protein
MGTAGLLLLHVPRATECQCEPKIVAWRHSLIKVAAQAHTNGDKKTRLCCGRRQGSCIDKAAQHEGRKGVLVVPKAHG